MAQSEESLWENTVKLKLDVESKGLKMNTGKTKVGCTTRKRTEKKLLFVRIICKTLEFVSNRSILLQASDD